jgi:hypothetical protein
VAERGATNARLVSEARAELEDRFPQLQDSAVYESVFETMTLLSQGSEFASSKEGNEVLIRRLMERAIRAQGLEEQPDEDADAKSKHERRAQAARGQPKAPRAAKATIVPENEQMTALALHLLKNPGDKRGAMRAIGY